MKLKSAINDELHIHSGRNETICTAELNLGLLKKLSIKTNETFTGDLKNLFGIVEKLKSQSFSSDMLEDILVNPDLQQRLLEIWNYLNRVDLLNLSDRCDLMAIYIDCILQNIQMVDLINSNSILNCRTQIIKMQKQGIVVKFASHPGDQFQGSNVCDSQTYVQKVVNDSLIHSGFLAVENAKFSSDRDILDPAGHLVIVDDWSLSGTNLNEILDELINIKNFNPENIHIFLAAHTLESKSVFEKYNILVINLDIGVEIESLGDTINRLYPEKSQNINMIFDNINNTSDNNTSAFDLTKHNGIMLYPRGYKVPDNASDLITAISKNEFPPYKIGVLRIDPNPNLIINKNNIAISSRVVDYEKIPIIKFSTDVSRLLGFNKETLDLAFDSSVSQKDIEYFLGHARINEFFIINGVIENDKFILKSFQKT
jgi:hypothetical protein